MPDMGAVPLTMRLSVVALAAALSAIPRPQVAQETPEPGRYGGALIVSRLGDPRTFNPIVAQETASTDVLRPIFGGLLEQNYMSSELAPAWADAGTVRPGGRTGTLTLREEV